MSSITDTINEILIMTELPPKCNPDGIYSVKRACAELGVSHKTFLKYRAIGLILPVNPNNAKRPKYTGRSIIDCWHKITEI